MLSLAPFLWGLGVYFCLIRYPGGNIVQGALHNALIFIAMATAMDYIFFGLIRGAMEELYHPTTFYGYGFLIVLPFIEVLIFKKHLKRVEKNTSKRDFFRMGLLGLVALLLVIVFAIINFEVSVVNDIFKK